MNRCKEEATISKQTVDEQNQAGSRMAGDIIPAAAGMRIGILAARR